MSETDYQQLDILNKHLLEANKDLGKEIKKLTAESTKWESKFYDEAKKVDKAIEYIEENKGTYESNEYCFDNMLEDVTPLLDILKGVDK